MILELDGVSHRYGTKRAVRDVSFGLAEGELVALLGPSGCGKTTIVQTIAGHVTPTAGRIRLRGSDVTDVPPERRRVGITFQRSTLYPHMTVEENVAYGLDARDMDPDRRAAVVTEYLELVELTGQRGSAPEELSGGQRRRVELARALAPEPDVLLLDEPLSALDRTLRGQLRSEIARIQRETGVTTLFVTHDQEEAMSLADRIVILRDGDVSAVGEPRTLYESPPNRFVASFLGRSNVIPATTETGDTPRLRISDVTVPFDEFSAGSATIPDPVVHVRPKDVVIDRRGTPGTDVELPGIVHAVTDVGTRYDVSVRLESGETVIAERDRSPPSVDERVTVGFEATDLTVFGDADHESTGAGPGSDPDPPRYPLR